MTLLVVAAGAPRVCADDRAAAAFLNTLRQAVSRGDRDGVARVIEFPLTVFVGSLRVPIENRAALVERFDLVFTPELQAALAREQPTVTDDGFVVDSVLTVKSIGGAMKIVKLVVPPAAAAPVPPARTAPPRSQSPRTSRARRIIVRGGAPPTEVAGIASRGDVQSYVVWAAANQLLQIRIDGVRGRDVVARVLDAKSGAPLDARARDGVRAWAGRVPATGDYRIDIAGSPGAAGSVGYRLSVSVR